MRLKKSDYFVLHILLGAVAGRKLELGLRIKRQAGYVYEKPSVSFDLPPRSPTVSTQATNVDRTLEQQMYYAYPVPSGGNSVTIGQTASTTSTATSGSTSGGAGAIAGATAGANAGGTAGGSTGSSPSGGYSYGTSNISGGYNYGTSSSGTQTANIESQAVNTGAQVSGTGSSSTGSGYGYNAPSPTLSPSLQGAVGVSTSAPKYLPPIGGGGNVNMGQVSVVTTGSGQVTTGTASIQTSSGGALSVPPDQYLPPSSNFGQVGSGYSSSGQSSSGSSVSSGVPSDLYLPPVSSNTGSPGPSPISIGVTSTGVQNNAGGSIPVVGSGYLSPNPLPSPSFPTPDLPNPSAPSSPTQNYLPPSSSSESTGIASTQNYLPPSSSSGSTGIVSTPAATYLPPVF